MKSWQGRAAGPANAAFTGKPLIAFSMILGGWIFARIMLWQSPFLPVLDARSSYPFAERAAPESPTEANERPMAGHNPVAVSAHAAPAIIRATQRQTPQIGPIVESHAYRGGTGHHLLMMAAFNYAPQFAGAQSGFIQAPLPFPTGRNATRAARPAKADRWLFDAWAFVREGAGRPSAAGPVIATYGGSQAGAVLRYRLRPDSGLDPKAYLRAVSSLSGPGQQDVAAGVSLKPVRTLPLLVAAEARVSQSGDATRLRPAIMVVSDAAPVHLPLGMRATSYAQAGYVGGEFATAFADGQAVVDCEVARFNLATVRAGVGSWAGVQKGAHRVDVGPTIHTDITVAQKPVLIAVDYRQRVDGNASPRSGFALTVSTSF